MAQILGKSFCCMQEYILKIQWLRYSGNPSAVCRNIFWKFNCSDTQEMLLLSAGTYFENSMAQILGKSFCCMQEHTFTIQWLRCSGHPFVVWEIIFWKSNGSDTLEILLLCAGTYNQNSMAQISRKSFCCMHDHTLKIQWLRYSGHPFVVRKHILWKFNGSDTWEICLLYAAMGMEE